MQHLPHNTQFGTKTIKIKHNSLIHLYLHTQIFTKLPIDKLLTSC